MPRFKVAHLKEQGVDLIIIPLDNDFGYKTDSEQIQSVRELQRRASSAGLRGAVIPVWDGGGGRMAFRAPHNYHPYFQSIDLSVVWANVNRELYW